MNKQPDPLRSGLVDGVKRFERSRAQRRLAFGATAVLAALGLIVGVTRLGDDTVEDQNVSASATAPVQADDPTPVDSPTVATAKPVPSATSEPGGVSLLDDPGWPQPSGGPGWRLLESIDAFTTEAEGPMGATTVEEIADLEQRYGLDLGGVDLETEIVITQMVIKALGPERRCGPHVIDNLRVVEGAFTFDLETPGEADSIDCPDGDSYQLFVVAMARELLPDTLRLPHRAALIEIEVR